MHSGHDWQDSLTHWVDSRRGGGGGGAPIARPIGVMMILLACLAGQPACCHQRFLFRGSGFCVWAHEQIAMAFAREHGDGLWASGSCVASSTLAVAKLWPGSSLKVWL